MLEIIPFKQKKISQSRLNWKNVTDSVVNSRNWVFARTKKINDVEDAENIFIMQCTVR